MKKTSLAITLLAALFFVNPVIVALISECGLSRHLFGFWLFFAAIVVTMFIRNYEMTALNLVRLVWFIVGIFFSALWVYKSKSNEAFLISLAINFWGGAIYLIVNRSNFEQRRST